MGVEDLINQRILAKTRKESRTDPIPRWKFVPSGDLKINRTDKGVYYGELYYANRLYNIFNAIKIGNWVFTLEKAKYDKSKSVFIGAFHENSHCTLMQVELIAPPSIELFREIILKYFFGEIYPIFFSEEDEEISFTPIAFTGDEAKSIQNPETYNGRGVLEGGLTLEQAKKYIEQHPKPN